RVALFDGNGRRKPFDKIDIRLLHLIEELPGIGRETFHVAPLAFGIESIEGERRFPRAAQPGDDHQLFPRYFDVEVLQIVLACTTDLDNLRRHFDEKCRTYKSSTAPQFLQ